MAAALEESPITYEELAEIEREFDDVETEIIRQQVHLTRPLYEKRHKAVSQIPNFWPLVIEQAPPDIDQYIQPADSALLLSSLTSLSVSHFEIEGEGAGLGDPRSVSIRWEFSENEYFEDRVLEKKFWHRRALDGWAGLVSEPVAIQWKKGKDLTAGLLGVVKRVWDEEQQTAAAAAAAVKDGSTTSVVLRRKRGPFVHTAEQKALKKRLENTSLGGLSFFAWFGYVGRRISAEESRLATEREQERRRLRREGKEIPPSLNEEDEDGDEEDDGQEDDDEESLEIFPDGDSLAVTITDDLWPGAIKYFTQAQEQDALSDDDFESDDEELDGDAQEASPGQRPSKKRKA